jgi:flagellar protein FliO/FliZ
MSLDLYWRFLLALAFVVALIGLLAWLARRFGLAGRVGAAKAGRRLAVVESAALDGKRRLVLVRRDDTEHLILIGAETALVVESGIAAPAAAPRPSFAASLAESAP